MSYWEWKRGHDGQWRAEEIAGDLGGAERADVSATVIRTKPNFMPTEALGRIASLPTSRSRVTKLDPAAYEALRHAAVMEAHARRPRPMGETIVTVGGAR